MCVGRTGVLHTLGDIGEVDLGHRARELGVVHHDTARDRNNRLDVLVDAIDRDGVGTVPGRGILVVGVVVGSATFKLGGKRQQQNVLGNYTFNSAH